MGNNQENPTDDPITAQQRERLLGQLAGEGITPEERLAINERFADVVDVVISWAEVNEHDIERLTPLGGGFKNPVLMVTTAKGKQFVAKGFIEEAALVATRKVHTRLSDVISEDEKHLIPDSEIYNDTLFSKKARGVPVKSLIKEAAAKPEQIERALEAFSAVGATLGIIHERTERLIERGEDPAKEVVAQAMTDRDKAIRHLDELAVADLLDLQPEEIEAIKERIVELTVPEYVSLIHGDAHLDQFFHEEGGATVEIVDYDDVREGDPMADLGRLIASQREWCARYGVGRDLEIGLTRAIVRGYESTRRESGLSSDNEELDVMRVVAYELRLHLVKLKGFKELRQRLQEVGSKISLSENEIIQASEDQESVIQQYLSIEEQVKLGDLRVISGELGDILQYLRPALDAGSQKK